MFLLIGEMREMPFGPEDIVKIHRGMNMVKVSVEEYLSEPSEVYIATIKDGEKLSTNVVFYLIEPKVRILYGFEGNPYEPSSRINIETEAREFVEEMGAILEDIGWENMSDEGQKSWLDQQYLFPTREEFQADQSVDDTVVSVEPGLEVESGKGKRQGPEEVEAEVDTEAEEEAFLPDIEVEDPNGAPVETSKEEERAVAGQEEVSDETATEEAAEPEGDTQAKRQTGESLEKADKKVVFVEEKFDEMLKQAFLISPDDTGNDEGTEREESAGAKVVEKIQVESADAAEDSPVKEETVKDARIQADSASEGDAHKPESTRDVEERS
ncbi:hypothetical protein EP232_05335, partial [bacterium]